MTRTAGLRAALACAIVLASASSARPQDQSRNFLNTLFNLQWLASHRGAPVEVEGKHAALTVYASAPLNFSTNPGTVPGRGSPQAYFAPWVLLDIREDIPGPLSLYATAQYTDYLHTRDSSLNSSYADFSAGLNLSAVSTKSFTVDVYSSASLEDNLRADYAQDGLEFGVTLGAFARLDAGGGHSLYANPVAGAATWLHGAGFSSGLTLGWNWDFADRWLTGAYAGGSFSTSENGTPVPQWASYIGLTLQWTICEGANLNANCVQTWNLSRSPDARYQDLTVTLALNLDARIFDRTGKAK